MIEVLYNKVQIVRLQAMAYSLYRYKRKTDHRRKLLIAAAVSGGLFAAVAVGAIALRDSAQPTRSGGSAAAGAANPEEDARPTPSTETANALEERVVKELDTFGSWLQKNKAEGFIGELGWPSGADGASWNDVADRWYKQAASYDLWTTAWAAGSWWGAYPMGVYGNTGATRQLDNASTQAEIVEKHLSSTFGDRRGVNVAGMEFGESVTNTTLGTPGQDYFYEPAESFAYLASRGIKTVRLPFRWERIQPQLNGPLKDSEVTAIRNVLDAAKANDIKVILDLHNYGEYKTAGGVQQLGAGLSHEQLADVWLRLSQAFKDHKAVLGYGIMNEPRDLPKGKYSSPAKNWEAASQAVVDALRKKGDKTTLFIGGYDWSSLVRWEKNHPKAWIKDSAHNFRYEAHHYWDRDGSGQYQASFADEVRKSE